MIKFSSKDKRKDSYFFFFLVLIRFLNHKQNHLLD